MGWSGQASVSQNKLNKYAPNATYLQVFMAYFHCKLCLLFCFKIVLVANICFKKMHVWLFYIKFGFHIGKCLTVKLMLFILYRHREHRGALPRWKWKAETAVAWATSSREHCLVLLYDGESKPLSSPWAASHPAIIYYGWAGKCGMWICVSGQKKRRILPMARKVNMFVLSSVVNVSIFKRAE